ncbi:MAG: aminotransferase class IV [Bryobacteraceae bacterium]|nr:aminotransferase class IV [Bryobacteraceae bacterium]
MHRFVLHNDTILDGSEPCLSPGQIGLMTGWGVFSTIRVSSGVLFEFPRHYRRMRRDAELMHVPFSDSADELEQLLLRLVEANGAPNCTLRVNVIRNNGGVFHVPQARAYDIVAFTAELANWGDSVRLGVIQQARHAQNVYAGTKVTSWGFNLTWYEQAHRDGFDEVLLLDESGYVSECTSANVFAVFGNEVRTPPLSCGCLPGITRELLLTEISCPPIVVVEKTLTLADLERADGIFVTSTTRDLLPVQSVQGILVKSSVSAMNDLSGAFQRHIVQYVSRNSNLAGVHDLP